MSSTSEKPLVGIIMGSKSDWDAMKAAAEMLARFGVAHESRVMSAHRTPAVVAEYASGAIGRGMEIIIAGAGGAAHLAGVVAAHTVIPVIGVPMTSALQGLDSLLSTVQMPKGIPVATVAIGPSGAANAGLLAVAILATSRPDLRAKLQAYREEMAEDVKKRHAAVNVGRAFQARRRRGPERAALLEVGAMSTSRLTAVFLVLVLGASSVPASAQIQLSGVWNPMRSHEDDQDRGPGPDLGDYTGLPINDAARLFAESWDASRLTLQEHQCRVHVAPYIYHGPLRLRIWEEKDPETQQVIAIKNYISTYEQTRTIWMDGRPHPSAFAPHTFMGFSTGIWEGDTLTVTTTHLKQGWLRRNGVPESDQTTVVEHFIRHGQYMTHIAIISDPVYLAEPMIRSTDFQYVVDDNGPWLWPCEYVGRNLGQIESRRAASPAGREPVHQGISDGDARAGDVGRRRPRDDLSRLPRPAEGEPHAGGEPGRGSPREPGAEPGHGRAAAPAGPGQRLPSGRRRRQRRRAGRGIRFAPRGQQIGGGRPAGFWTR